MSLINQDFDSVVISIETYIFLVITSIKWLFLGFAFFSFSSFLWLDRQLCYYIIITSWFAYFCIHMVAYIQQRTIESIIDLRTKNTIEEPKENGGN